MGNGSNQVGSPVYTPKPLGLPESADSTPVAPKPLQSQKPQEAPAAAAKNSRGLKMHGTENKGTQTMQAEILKNELAKQVLLNSTKNMFDQTQHERTEAKTVGGSSNVKFQEPQRLPGRMITVTLLDEKRRVIDSRPEPLYDDVPSDTFFGEVKGKNIVWEDNAVVNAKIGTKLDKDGRPTGGISVENWAASKNARYVAIKIENAKQREEKTDTSVVPGLSWTDEEMGLKPPKKISDKQHTSPTSDPQTSKKSITNRASNGAGDGQRKDNMKKGDQDRVGQKNATGQYGHYSDKGRSRVGQGATYGTNAGKNAKGDRLGQQGGEAKPGGYFYDPDLAKVGAKGALPDPKGKKVGIPGGEGGGDNTVSGGGGGPIKVPKEIAPIVAATMIVLEADIRGVADDVVKASVKLGKTAAGKSGALAKTIARKLDKYVDAKVAKLADEIYKKDGFANKTQDQVQHVMKEIREGIREEANNKLAAELDRRIIENENALNTIRNNGDGAKLAAQRLKEETAAIRRAKEVLPDRSVRPNPEPDEVLPTGQARPQKLDRQSTSYKGWEEVPSELREEVGKTLEELKAARRYVVQRDPETGVNRGLWIDGDPNAGVKLAQRNPRRMHANYEGWTELYIKGAANPYRVLYKENADGTINWMVRDPH